MQHRTPPLTDRDSVGEDIRSRSGLWCRELVRASELSRRTKIAACCLADSESGRPPPSSSDSLSAAGSFVLQAESLLKPEAHVWHCWPGRWVARLRFAGRYRWRNLVRCFRVLAAFTSSCMKLTGQQLRS